MANFALAMIFSAVDHISEKFEHWGKEGEKFEQGQKQHFKGASEAAKGFGSVLAANLAMKGIELIGEGIKKAAEELPEFAEKGEQIARTAKIIGIGAEDLQRFQYAAKMTSTDVNGMQAALEKMNKGMGGLSKNQGPLIAGLRRINPQLLDQLKTAKDSKTAFLMVSDAMTRTSSAQQRAAIATAVFGKAGQDMIPMLLKGKEGLGDLMQEADKYGSILGGPTLEASEKFVESAKKIKGVLGALKDTALAGLLEGIGPIVDKMAEWLGSNRKFIQSGISNAISIITNLISKLAPIFEKVLGTLLPAIGGAVEKLGPVLDTVFGAVGSVIENLAPLLGPMIDSFMTLSGPLKLVGDLLGFIMKLLQGPLTLAFKALGAYVNFMLMVWSQTFGRIFELVLKGVAMITHALGKDTSGIDAAIKDIQEMRTSTTESVFGKPSGKEAPNAAALAAGQSSYQGRLEIAGAPQGSKLTGTYRGAAQIRPELAGAAGGSNL